MEEPFYQDEEEPAGGPGLDGIPVDGEPDNQGKNDLVVMQVWRAATMLGLNPDDGFNEGTSFASRCCQEWNIVTGSYCYVSMSGKCKRSPQISFTK